MIRGRSPVGVHLPEAAYQLHENALDILLRHSDVDRP